MITATVVKGSTPQETTAANGFSLFIVQWLTEQNVEKYNVLIIALIYGIIYL